MKNANVKKINTVGRVSRIVLLVFRICLIIGIVASLVGVVMGIIGTVVVPDDAVRADITVNGTVEFDNEKIPSFISSEILDLEETNVKFGLGNFKIKLFINKIIENSANGYVIDGNASFSDTKLLMLGVVGVFAVSAIGCGVMLVVVIFGGRLAKALETCESPFEEKVIKAMKSFAFSLIPVGVVVFLTDGVLGLTTAFIVAAIFLFAFVFKYGAELQQQADETV